MSTAPGPAAAADLRISLEALSGFACAARQVVGDVLGAFEVTAELAQVHKLLAPVAPTSIVGIGLNYHRHAAEGHLPEPAQPVVFMKLPGAVQSPGDPIRLPRHLRSDEVDYECEWAVVIGRSCRNVSKEE